MGKTKKNAASIPSLGDRRLDRGHLDAIHVWLAGRRGADEIRALQADLLAWSPKQRGLGPGLGLEGLWRATEIVHTSGELTVDDPDYDDIESIEAADEAGLDGQSTYSDDTERLFYFLEIRGDGFREFDASVYPVVSRVHNFDADTLGYVEEEEASDFVAGAIYRLWEWGTTPRADGFAPIAEVQLKAKKGRRPARPTEAFLLNYYHQGDGILIDRLRRPSAGVLERSVYMLWDGVYTGRIQSTYECFAAPLVGPGDHAAPPGIDLPITRSRRAPPRQARKPVKAARPARRG